MVAEPFTVDLNKPLVFQVGHLGELYHEWIHQPIVTKQSPRFFQHDCWEFLTRTAWWVIPLVWLPVVILNGLLSIRRGLSPLQAAEVICLGIILWSLIEYILHRFLFHMKTTSYWGNTLHYLLHGCHHKHPQDSYRLVFPPAGTAILSIPLWLVTRVVFPHAVAPSVFGGVIFGYMIYDIIHYYLHHGNATNKTTRRLKKYHFNHHFKSQSSSFGITSGFWDWVFGTLPAK